MSFRAATATSGCGASLGDDPEATLERIETVSRPQAARWNASLPFLIHASYSYIRRRRRSRRRRRRSRGRGEGVMLVKYI